MSWWIKEVISTNRDQKQRLCSCECDDMTVIPDPIQYTDDTQTVVEYTIVRGSILYCLENSKTYKLNSQGQWVEQKTGQEIEIGADDITYDNTDSGLTATNVQDAIDDLKDTDDTQDDALAELYGMDANQQLEINYAINTGVKNLFDINASATANHMISSLVDGSITVTSNGNWSNYNVPVSLPAGDYIFSATISDFSKDSSAGANSVRIRIAENTSGGTAAALETVTGNGPMTIHFTHTGGQLYVQFYPNFSSTSTYVSTFTASNIMIRNAVVKSSIYEPYAPTNRELYETKATVADICGQGTKIYEIYASLNDIMTPGRYYVATGSQAVTVSDSPYTEAGYGLYVIANSSNGRPTQLMFPNPVQGVTSTYGLFYKREYIYNAWGPWFKFQGIEVTSNQQQSLNSPLNLSRNDLNEHLDGSFNLIDSITGEEEGDLDV